MLPKSLTSRSINDMNLQELEDEKRLYEYNLNVLSAERYPNQHKATQAHIDRITVLINRHKLENLLTGDT